MHPVKLAIRSVIAAAVFCSLFVTTANAQVTLSAQPEAGINEAIVVSFEGTLVGGDVIRFADPEGNTLGGSYAYPGNSKDGTVTLAAPLEPGDYQIVHLAGGEIIARSPLTVHSVEAQLEAPASLGMNESFDVAFTGPENRGDTIVVTTTEGKAIGGLYAYVGLAKEGKVSLRAPAEPGSYLVTYQTGSIIIGQQPLEVMGLQANLSAPATVQAGAHFMVEWEGPNNSGDILRIFDLSGSNMGSYGYVALNPEGVPLRAPETPGTYRVVYLTANEEIGATEFTVTEISASLEAPASVPGDERFSVAWEGPGNHGDVIQLIPVGQTDDVAYTYVNTDEGNTAFVLAPSKPGPHELHYVTHGGQVLATRAIEITPPVLKPGWLQVLAHPQPRLGAGDAVEVVLDASGSMLQRQGSDRRIEIAKRTLQGLISETIPEGTPFAMRVFGHKEADSCRTDLEIPLGPLNRAEAGSTLAGVNAMNLAKTPIADSLAQTESDLRGVSGERIIVLVTDGEETCEGDPATVIAGMRARGQNIRFNIVGYAIEDEGLQDTFERWATLGGGAYFNAADESQLGEALTTSVSPSFTVMDASGAVVGTGVAGGESLQLSPGIYSVQMGEETRQAEVMPETRTAVDFN